MFTCDLRDSHFRSNNGACYVTGYWGFPWIDQFPGAGPSPSLFKFKAVERDGVIYIPMSKRLRGDCPPEAVPMVVAEVQPTDMWIERL